MSSQPNLKKNSTPARILREYFHFSFSLYYVRVFCLLLLSQLFYGCDGSYSSNPTTNASIPGVSGAVVSDLSTPTTSTDARLAYAFTDDIVMYSPSCPGQSCTEYIPVGNPVNSYAIDPVTGGFTLIGEVGDLSPPNTLSIALAPSSNFLYLLSGENLVHTFSIGYLNVTGTEFANQKLDPLKLYYKLVKGGYISEAVLSPGQATDNLITLLEETTLFDQIAAKNPNITLTNDLAALKTKTVAIRGKSFSILSFSDRKAIVNLNRLMLELVYPDDIPKNKGFSSLHAVGSPVSTPTVPWGASIVIDPLGKFAYVLGSSSVWVYSINQATGALTSRAVQSVGLSQLIITPSGSFAYGSNNGTMHTYKVERSTGVLNEIGSSYSFKSWVGGVQFHNMALDPTGKFLYYIGSSGFHTNLAEFGQCGSTRYQLGSLIYTFIIDANTGLLTQSGAVVDTTPNIMVWGAVDPNGRFVQLLNTQRYSGNPIPPYTDGICPGPTTNDLKPGHINSYLVDPSSGQLFSTGNIAAGGREYQPGYVNAALDSVMLLGNITGSYLYLLNAGDMYMYNIDQADGSLTVTGSPLTGATITAMPVKKDPPNTWPSKCYSNSQFNSALCRVTDSRFNSIIWAGH